MSHFAHQIVEFRSESLVRLNPTTDGKSVKSHRVSNPCEKIIFSYSSVHRYENRYKMLRLRRKLRFYSDKLFPWGWDEVRENH